MPNIPDAPLTREEQYLAAIANGGGSVPPAPLTRVEQYLNAILQGGGGGGGSDLPSVTSADNGKVLAVSGGAWAKGSIGCVAAVEFKNWGTSPAGEKYTIRNTINQLYTKYGVRVICRGEMSNDEFLFHIDNYSETFNSYSITLYTRNGVYSGELKSDGDDRYLKLFVSGEIVTDVSNLGGHINSSNRTELATYGDNGIEWKTFNEVVDASGAKIGLSEVIDLTSAQQQFAAFIQSAVTAVGTNSSVVVATTIGSELAGQLFFAVYMSLVQSKNTPYIDFGYGAIAIDAVTTDIDSSSVPPYISFRLKNGVMDTTPMLFYTFDFTVLASGTLVCRVTRNEITMLQMGD